MLRSLYSCALVICFMTCQASDKATDVPPFFPLPGARLIQEANINITTVQRGSEKNSFYAFLKNGDHIRVAHESGEQGEKYKIRYTKRPLNVYELVAFQTAKLQYHNKYPNFGGQGQKPSSATTQDALRQEFQNAREQFGIIEGLYNQENAVSLDTVTRSKLFCTAL